MSVGLCCRSVDRWRDAACQNQIPQKSPYLKKPGCVFGWNGTSLCLVLLSSTSWNIQIVDAKLCTTKEGVHDVTPNMLICLVTLCVNKTSPCGVGLNIAMRLSIARENATSKWCVVPMGWNDSAILSSHWLITLLPKACLASSTSVVSTSIETLYVVIFFLQTCVRLSKLSTGTVVNLGPSVTSSQHRWTV